jgi:hypothetical protein
MVCTMHRINPAFSLMKPSPLRIVGLFCCNRKSVALAMLVLLSGCATKEIQRPALVENSATNCQAPSGFYANYGQTVGDARLITPPLSGLLWEGELAGFNIDRISLETRSDGILVINAWAGETRLDESLEFNPQDRDCDDGRWRFTTRWDAQILNGVVAGLLWTGGIFLPAAERDEYSLLFTETGQLSVRYIGRLTGTFFFFFPMYLKSEESWFVYDRIETNGLVTALTQ